jgi:hypothetical protein
MDLLKMRNSFGSRNTIGRNTGANILIFSPIEKNCLLVCWCLTPLSAKNIFSSSSKIAF